ncbi:hypothetical protein PFISCL1PPCAC_23722 [Pristionchus fissidentatus]|uniref:Uncharacterized protein n=1 Tax=Pristionchus fissidentatus TaxID=1538716 RepID=A0AAV5WP96_9BILA|nr:hypothetical protein PFISCL1PPCAC_23722 [Pristionchus fissidentatus]
MKNRYTTLDVVAAVHDLKQYIGMRVANIYDVNSKTYLIKLQKPDHKAMIMFESGLHILSTGHAWEKSQFPSSFSMKLRKHVKNRRLESVDQVGVDRVVDLGFGDEQSRVHVIVELYDRGNILLTDQDYTILNILRPRTDKDTDVKFAVRNRYPVENARTETTLPSDEQLTEAVTAAAANVQARRLLSPLVPFGGALIEHALVANQHPKDVNMTNLGATVEERVRKLRSVIEECSKVYASIHENACQGFITFKSEQSPSGDTVESFIDYHPYHFAQCSDETTKTFGSFSEAVDEFLSKMTSQKADQKALHIEKEALKKLENVKKDQEERVVELDRSQEKLKVVAELIIKNKEMVERAREIILSALAHQLSWDRIGEMCREATRAGDKVASRIVQLKLDTNHIVMRLTDPYLDGYDEEEVENEPVDVPIDLALNAFQNSKKLFDAKKAAGAKKEKTIQSSVKALKNAEAKAKATLETVRVRKDLAKTRKPMWFEKFLWFVSRDGLVCVAGRDAQQNELLVKRYLRTDDVYVHADVRGAASVVIRNKPGGGEIPPKTLTEAAQMAVCYSNAWDAKVVASAWWVNKSQVTRTAPSGEYLTPGSFMIRGKKNFMPASQLIMGMGILFKLDEESVERRREERKRKEEERAGDGKEGEEEVKEEKVEDEEGEELAVEEDSEGEEDGDEKKEEEEEEFPDVQVPLSSLSVGGGTGGEEEYSIISVGPTTRTGISQKEMAERREREKIEKEKCERERREKEKEARATKPRTKREKHKMEKIKQKYGDQDEEERELRMTALGSRGKKAEEKKEEPAAVEEEKPRVERPPRPPREEKEKKGDEEDEEEEKEEGVNDDESNLIETLTGDPTPEDTLLYAVVCVAPYQVLSDYKYKVKLIPGTGKRGKAAKSAIELFMRSKKASPREESLLKALLGDEASARNIPGKVKVSAPNLHAK